MNTEIIERGETVKHNGMIMQVRSRNADGTYALCGMTGNPLRPSVPFDEIIRKVNGAFPPEKQSPAKTNPPPPPKKEVETPPKATHARQLPKSVKPDAIVDPEDQTPLTEIEIGDLKRNETTIEAGIQTYVAVGEALLDIRDRRLYRQQYHTWEEYCHGRWGWGRNYANKLIVASETARNLGTIVPILPQNETQVRPLTQLPAEQQVRAWQEAVESAPAGKVTAKHVRQIVDQKLGKKTEKPPKQGQKAAKTSGIDEKAPDNVPALEDNENLTDPYVADPISTDLPNVTALRAECHAIIDALGDDRILVAHQILSKMKTTSLA